ncbi:MAG: DUF1614 domain-containing protein [Chloroflexota bacterium]
MGCLALLLPVLLVLPILFVLLLLNVITISLAKLGLSAESALALLVAILIGSMINIPISRRRIRQEETRSPLSVVLFHRPPRVTEQVVAVNVGGAILPAAIAIYLLPHAPLLPTVVATGVVATIARLIARPVPGTGIVMPAWIPPLASALLAFLLARQEPAPVAYISGTMGTLVGADLLNWPNFKKLRSHVLSIGGAGVFDGIFLAGIVAVLLT